jgi:hypothetical protein
MKDGKEGPMKVRKLQVGMLAIVLFVLIISISRTALAQTVEPAAPVGKIEELPVLPSKPEAQPDQPAKLSEPFSTVHKLRLQIEGYLGIGLDSSTVGVTSDGKDVKISGGGGAGFGATMGYGVSKQFDIEGTLGVQASGLQPAVKNAHGSFGRTFLLATAKYKVPIRENLQWKFGLGAGYYMAGKLDIEVDQGVPGAAHTVVDYKNSVGAHATGELEILLRERLSLSVGLKYYTVTYKADKATVNGITVPVSFLSDEYRNFKGDGVDITAGLAAFF